MHRLALLLVPLVAGCSDVVGEFRITPRVGKSRSFVPCGCASAEPVGLFGVDLFDEEQAAFRVARFPAYDQRVRMSFHTADFQQRFHIVPDACTEFEGDLEPTGEDVGGLEAIRGQIRLDCTASGGEHVRGEVDFDSCGAPGEDDWMD